MKYAVIIKHPYRDGDYRVDIVEADENVSTYDIKRLIEREMLGPFEVISITEKLCLDRKIDLSKLGDTETHQSV